LTRHTATHSRARPTDENRRTRARFVSSSRATNRTTRRRDAGTSTHRIEKRTKVFVELNSSRVRASSW